MIKAIRFKWRTVFTSIAVVSLGIFSYSTVYSADDVGELLSEKLKKFTPSDLKVVPPAEDVPKECAMFTGEWGPTYTPRTRTATKLVVESIASDCTIKVVVVWAQPREFANDPGAGWARHNVKIVQGSFELPGLSRGRTWFLLMNSSGTYLEVATLNPSFQSLRFEYHRQLAK